MSSPNATPGAVTICTRNPSACPVRPTFRRISPVNNPATGVRNKIPGNPFTHRPHALFGRTYSTVTAKQNSRIKSNDSPRPSNT